MAELGHMLREAREAKELSLEEVERATRIRRSYLEALEAEEFGRLPGDAFVKGFLRNYAAYLGLDPQSVVALYAGPSKAVPIRRLSDDLRDRTAPVEVPLQVTPFGGMLKYVLLGILVLALVGGAYWGYVTFIAPQGLNLNPLAWLPAGRPTPTPTVTVQVTPTATEVNTPIAAAAETEPPAAPATSTPIPATPTPSDTPTLEPTDEPTPTATWTPLGAEEGETEPVEEATAAPPESEEPTAAPPAGEEATATPAGEPAGGAGPVEVHVEITEESWLAVTVDGTRVYEGILTAGEERTWSGNERIAMRVGNAGGVLVTVNGESLGPLGESGDVVDREWTAEGAVVTP